MKRIIETAKEVLTSVKKNPLDIKLLLLFSIVITFISELIQLDSNRDLYQSIIPFTGSQPGRKYDNLIIFIIVFSYHLRDHQNRLLIIRGICTFYIGLSLYDGISDWTTILPEDYTNPNPYLRYDPLRTIYTICLPLILLLIVSGSQLKDYFNNKK